MDGFCFVLSSSDAELTTIVIAPAPELAVASDSAVVQSTADGHGFPVGAFESFQARTGWSFTAEYKSPAIEFAVIADSARG